MIEFKPEIGKKTDAGEIPATHEKGEQVPAKSAEQHSVQRKKSKDGIIAIRNSNELHEPFFKKHMSQPISMKSHEFPDIGDLRSSVRFDAGTGCIWLEQQRVMLLHTSAFGALRDELFESMGTQNAKGVLFRMGLKSGEADAHLARRLRPDASDEDTFAVGPQPPRSGRRRSRIAGTTRDRHSLWPLPRGVYLAKLIRSPATPCVPGAQRRAGMLAPDWVCQWLHL